VFDTLYLVKEKLIEPNLKLFFKFQNGDTLEHDNGIDAGSLSKTVFHELSVYFMSNEKYFTQDEYTKLYTLTDQINETMYSRVKFIGQLFAIVLKLKLTIPIKLDPLLLYQMSNDDFYDIDSLKIQSLIATYDDKLFAQIPYECYKLSTKPWCKYDEEGTLIEGEENIVNETTKKIKTMYKNKSVTVKKFVDGFRSMFTESEKSIKTLNLLKKLPLNLFNELLHGKTDITFDILMEHLNFINNTYGNRKISTENFNKGVLLIKNIIKKNMETDPTYVQILLLAMTGGSTISAIGFPKDKLRIEIDDIGDTPISTHSCFNQMIISSTMFNYFINETNNIEDTVIYKGLTKIELLKDSGNLLDA